jgi:hypothetical protein
VSKQQSDFFQEGSGERLFRVVPSLDARSHISLPTDLVNPRTANVVYRREVLEEIGYFNPQMSTGGDFDLGWRRQTQTDWESFMEEAFISDLLIHTSDYISNIR